MRRPIVLVLLAAALVLAVAVAPGGAQAPALTVTGSPPAPAIGQAVTWTAAISGGDAGWEFRFTRAEDEVVARDWDPSPTYVDADGYPANGTYRMIVDARKAGETDLHAEAEVVLGPPLDATLAVDRQRADVNEPFAFAATTSGGTGSGLSYEWSVDGAIEQIGPSATFRRSFTALGQHTVAVTARDDGRNHVTRSVQVTVGPPPLSGSIEVIPEHPRKLQPVTVRARPEGGKGAIEIRWDVNLYGWPDDNDFLSSGGPETSFTMPDRDSVVVRARFRDAAGQEYIARREIGRERDWAADMRLQPGPDVEVGDGVIITGWATDGVPPVRAWLGERGAEPQAFDGGYATIVREWREPGTHELVFRAQDAEGRTAEVTRTVRVDPRLVPDVVVETEDVAGSDERRVTVDASGTAGGRGPLRFAFDLGDDGTVEQQGASATLVRRFAPRALPDTVRVTVTDATGRVRTRVRSVPARCSKDVAVGLLQVKTTGCLVNRGSEAEPRWETGAAVTVNGIPIDPPAGRRLVLKGATRESPGGRLGVPDVAIKVGGVTLWRGDIDWELPAPQSQQGYGEGTVAQLRVPDQAKLLGLPVEGSFGLRFGRSGARAGTNREYYAAFPLQFGLPSVFKSRKGAGGTEGGVTAEGSVRVDGAGEHYDGLKLQVADVWAGSVQVKGVCLSYVPAGGQSVSPCPAPALDGREYVTCQAPVDSDRWNATAAVELPGGSRTRLAAFGGIAGGRLSSLGGYVDNARIPLVAGVYLSRIGFGFCVGPPLVLRGDVGVQILPVGPSELVQINGYFIYTDPFEGQPWSIELGGSVELRDFPVGQGFVKLRPSGLIDFSASAAMKLPQEKPVVTVEGGLGGWVEIPSRSFTIEGYVRGCLVALDACAGARGLISNSAIAGCMEVVGLKGGFAYVFVTRKVDLFSGCDLSAYAAVPVTARAAQAGAPIGFEVAGGKQAAVEVTGVSGPPKVTLRGPDGTVIASPSDRQAAAVDGRYVLVENPEQKTTSILLGNPAAGHWTVSGDGIASVRTARYVGPTTISGRVTRRGGRRFRAAIRFRAPEGTHVRLVEKSGTVQRTVVADADARPCGAAQCFSTDFRAADGPGGRRKLVAVLTRDGRPAGVHTLAHFRAPAAIRPGRPRALRARRVRGGVVVSWRAAPRADGHAIEVRTGYGKRFPVVPPDGRTTVRLRGIARGEQVVLRVTGLRGADLRTGPAARLVLRRGARRAG